MPRRTVRDTYALVPHWFVREAAAIFELTPVEITIYLTLCDHADANRMTWVPQSFLAEQSGSSRSSVKRATKRLIDFGLIEIAAAETNHRARRYHLAEKMPLPPKVYPMPTRRARYEGNHWVGYEADEGI